MEAARNGLIGRVEPQRQVGGQHGRSMALAAVMRVGHQARAGAVLGRPLLGARRAAGQLPLIVEQIVEEVVAPLRGRGGPGHLEPAADGVAAHARAMRAAPAQALLGNVGAFRLRTHQRCVARAMGLAEGVAACDQRNGLFVVHRHAGKGVANVARRRQRVRIAIGAFGIDVDQAHLHGRQRVFQVAVAAIALVGQPLALGAPVDVLLGFPHIGAPTGEAEGFEAHGFQRHIAGQDHQIRPGNGIAVFLLDRPQQAPRLVQVHIVRPAVERRKALLPGPGAAAAIAGAIGAGAVPGHADEQRAIVPEVRRPPVLAVGHQRGQISLEGRQVQRLEGFGIVEVRAHRVRQRRLLVQHRQVELVGPPFAVAARHRAMRHRALAGAGCGFSGCGFIAHGKTPVVYASGLWLGL